ncbi:MAG: hypothetical protein DM484_21045 [Candidatus Methylumidiphilus alinenensis]|uniref:DUF4276 domain-containing protein n=1 Tax=Candidatus Methylumidiphilus alinenensis TaxID=2202197 RepID=A0A2W4QSK7_9GAMM|nr:MAG: hypothetical protein DM484_21045 [Candidatus Methylumidiphilus alinenensis]
MRSLVFLLEEPSAQDALEGFLPYLLPDGITVKYLVFEGKQDLEKRMTRTLRAWRQPNTRFIVLRDQDSGDCRVVKEGLLERCREAGRENETMVRIACRELEAWFVGDWVAVASAFDNPKLLKLSKKANYRDGPDGLDYPVEELRKHIPQYQKRDGARRIGPYLRKETNASRSFQVFVDAVLHLVAE